MAQVELIMPKMGESIMEATILKWLKQEGDTVELDETVLEIATDKVDSEVPSSVAGVVSKLLFQEGDVVEIGKAIAVISTDGDAAAPTNGTATQTAEVATPAPVPQETPPAPSPAFVQTASSPAASSAVSSPAVAGSLASGQTASGNGRSRFYSPLVMNIARQENISMAELESLPGTGKEGRVTKKDILGYVKVRPAGGVTVSSGAVSTPTTATLTSSSAVVSPTPTAPSSRAAAAPSKPAASIDGRTEIVEMDRMRKLIAKHMVASKTTSAHVTSFVEADVTTIVKWRTKVKNAFYERYGEKITYTPIMIEAIVKAIKDFPMINVSVDGDNLIVKKDINVGMAAALPSGNLIVPVIKNADQYNLIGLTRQVNDLANRARLGKLKPHEIEGGTYTMSNVGTFGNVMGTPIINQPQVAIMAIGAIRKKPAVIETPQGDFIGVRSMMFLSHAYDHRVVDGYLGGSFVRRVADYLEAFDPEREI